FNLLPVLFLTLTTLRTPVNHRLPPANHQPSNARQALSNLSSLTAQRRNFGAQRRDAPIGDETSLPPRFVGDQSAMLDLVNVGREKSLRKKCRPPSDMVRSEAFWYDGCNGGVFPLSEERRLRENLQGFRTSGEDE